MAGLVNYSAVLQDADGSNLRFVANEHKFQTWGAGQSGTSGLSGILGAGNHTTVMTIRGSNVGIGVTLPVAKLQVAGGVGIGTAYAAIAPPADGCIVAGNVGIGTANPVATLQVAGSVGIGAAYSAFVPPADGCIVAGNVGIGTTNPLARLHVNGNFYAPGSVVQKIVDAKVFTYQQYILSSTTEALLFSIASITPKFANSLITFEIVFTAVNGSNDFNTRLFVRKNSIGHTNRISSSLTSPSNGEWNCSFTMLNTVAGHNTFNFICWDYPATTSTINYILSGFNSVASKSFIFWEGYGIRTIITETAV